MLGVKEVSFAFVFILAIVWVVLKLARFFKWRSVMNAIGGPTTDGFLIGNIGQIGDQVNYLSYGSKNATLFPKIYRSWFGPTVCQITVCHPETVRVVMNAKLEKAWNYAFFKDWFGPCNLLCHPNEGYDETRKLISPSLSVQVLSSYYPVYIETTDILCKKWATKAGTTFNIAPDLGLQALDTILLTSFGLRSNCQHGGVAEYVHCTEENARLLLVRCFKPLHHNEFIYAHSADGKAFKHNAQVIQSLARTCIRERRATLASGVAQKKERLDIIDVLLTARDEVTGVGFTEEEILHHVNSIIFAGHDTSSTTLTNLFYALACYPHYQEQCFEEVSRLVKGEYPTIEEAKALEFTYYCLKESMRLYITVPAMGRTLKTDLELDGKKIPAGSWIEINNWALHRNPAVWEDPDVFNPNRMAVPHDPFAWLPFGAGQRNCPGQHFAMLEMKAVLASLIKKFKFVIDPEVEAPRFESNCVLRSVNGMQLRVEARA